MKWMITMLAMTSLACGQKREAQAQNAGQLAALEAAYKSGVLTREEYESKRRALASAGNNSNQLAALETAYKSGVLSRDEYEAKKRALLAGGGGSEPPSRPEPTPGGGGISPAPYVQRSGPLPDRQAPQGFQMMRDQGGTGRILRATFQGNARSAVVTLKGILGDLGQHYFDGKPEILTALGSNDDQRAQAFFRSQMQGVPVTGFLMVGLTQGNGMVNVLLDGSAQFQQSFRRMAAMAGGGGGGPQGGSAPRRQIQWVQLQFPDGSGSIALPSDWRMTSAAKGAVDCMGPRGEVIGLGGPYIVNTNPVFAQSGYLVGPYMGPVQALQYLFPQMARMFQRQGSPLKQLTRILESQPVADSSGAQAAYTLYDATVAGRPYRWYEMDSTRPIDQTSWLFYMSQVGAPADVFAQEFPLMLEIWQQWRISGKLIASRLRAAAESMREAGEILRQSNANTSATYDRTNKAWDLYIRGNEVVEHIPTGGRGEVDMNHAQRIVESLNQNEGGQVWRVVPMRDY